MGKDTIYFKHDANAHDDPMIKLLRKKYGMAGYGRWWLLIEAMRAQEGYCLPYTTDTFDSLATDMDCPTVEVKKFIDFCINKKLFSKNGPNFFSARLNRDMAVVDARREQQKQAGISSAQKRGFEAATPPTDVERPFNERSTDVKPPSNERSTVVERTVSPSPQTLFPLRVEKSRVEKSILEKDITNPPVVPPLPRGDSELTDNLEILPGQSQKRCVAIARGELESTALLKKRVQDELRKRGIDW